MKDGAGVATASQTVGPFFHLGLQAAARAARPIRR